jgi:flagellar hook-basal body complex protein FliE
MPIPISAVGTPAAIPAIQSPTPQKSAGGFQSVLTDAFARVEQFQQNSATTIDKFLSGENEEVHKVALATQQAEISFDLFLQMRNKVISAYQEVMRMQM